MLVRILSIIFLVVIAQAQLFSVNEQFQISNRVASDELAHIIYEKTDRQTGWNRLYIYANWQVSPLKQHQAAGYLQGYATYRQIWSAFVNYIKLDFEGNPHAPLKVDEFLQKQISYMDQMVASNPDELFWTYIGYYLAQVRYMHAGYNARVKVEKKSQYQLEFQQFYYLTSVGDLEDLLQFDTLKSWDRKNCNAYVRLSNKVLYTAHSTHNRYTLMLRIFKTWNFPRNEVPLQSVSFSSRPADLISKDDFFILSSGLRVMETTLVNYNPANLVELKYNTVPSWIRTVVANHLSSSPEEWIAHFNTSRSGTHNNQWIIADSKRIERTSGVVLFFEEAFSLSATIDMTSQLLQKGYVAGYNLAITVDIYHKLGWDQSTGDPTYRTDIRAKDFERLHPKMQTIQDMKYYLINNDEGVCQGLAPRCDLNTTASPFGLIDCKIVSTNTLQQNYFWAISGPTTSHGRFQPFDWKQWSEYPHEGLPQIYDFEWQKISLNVQQGHLRKQQDLME